MTKQIIIKLNERKFKPLLEQLAKDGHGSVSSYSELVGKIIFFDFLLWKQKIKRFNDKTSMQFLTNALKPNKYKLSEKFLRSYKKFAKTGKIMDF